MTFGINDQWDVDLIDMSKYSKKNNGVAFELIVIDTVSWGCNLLRSKKAKVSLQHLKMFFEKAVVLPEFAQI